MAIWSSSLVKKIPRNATCWLLVDLKLKGWVENVNILYTWVTVVLQLLTGCHVLCARFDGLTTRLDHPPRYNVWLAGGISTWLQSSRSYKCESGEWWRIRSTPFLRDQSLVLEYLLNIWRRLWHLCIACTPTSSVCWRYAMLLQWTFLRRSYDGFTSWTMRYRHQWLIGMRSDYKWMRLRLSCFSSVQHLSSVSSRQTTRPSH